MNRGSERQSSRLGFPWQSWEHKTDAVAGFTACYGDHTLGYVEFHPTMADAILREIRVKKWRRAWKIALIERANPGWLDLYAEIQA